MRGKTISFVARTMAVAAVIGSSVLAAHAGPPLVCWKVQIGGAKSLPWDDTVRRFDGSRADYKTSALLSDTLVILDQRAPVLVRMETLRRAALYAAKDPAAGRALLTRLIERARGVPEGATGDGTAGLAAGTSALAWFDAGYYLESCRQAADSVDREHLMTKVLAVAGVRSSGEKLLQSEGALNGYSWVVKALAMRGPDPEMEFAASLMTWHPRRPEHEQHLARAVAGAAEESLLAKNILQFFEDRGKTLSAIRASLGSAAR